MGSTPRIKWENRLANRRKKLISLIKNEIAIFPAKKNAHMSRDQNYPYLPDSDFYYFTGFEECSSVLVLRNTGDIKSILYLKDRNPEEERWTGERLGIKRARKRFNIDDIRPIENFNTDFPSLAKGASAINYAPGANPDIDKIIWSYLSSPTSPVFEKPAILKDSRLLTSHLRLIKDKDEIGFLKRASQITARALIELAPHIPNMNNEKHCAQTLESLFAKYGGQGTAFETIVASGKNATILHHHPSHSPIWKRDLLLIDCGTKFKNYSGDISRVFPVSGTFSNIQAEVYDVVEEAVSSALNKSYNGSSLEEVHQASVNSISRGLISLGVLKGNPNHIVARGLYKPYFMHRTSHLLGIDVHDIAPNSINDIQAPYYLQPLKSGMTFTIEPGLYFPHDDLSISKELRGIGIRLEEDILITNKGTEVLSQDIPIKRKEIQGLMG